MMKHAFIGAGYLLLTAGAALAQTAPGAPGSKEVIPEKQAPPISQPSSDSDVKTGRSLSNKLDESNGVIKPSGDVDPAMNKAAPVPNPNSTPVIKPPGTPGGEPGAQPK